MTTMENIFGRNLKRYRKKAKMTQKQFSKMVGISQPHLSSWENGLSYPQIPYLFIIADKLGCEPENLIAHEKGGMPDA